MLAARQQCLDALLLKYRELWHPQPFRERHPAWCERWPDLAGQLLRLSDAESAHFNDSAEAALNFLAPAIDELDALKAAVDIPNLPISPLPAQTPFWDWEIPGRKREQIEAFAMATRGCGQPVLDWCGGKGHLGRLLALAWQQPVHSLDIDAALCSDGQTLARRAGAAQQFICADALQVTDWPHQGQHAVALHACGELHRRLIREGAERGVAGIDVAPCCYHRGVAKHYQALSSGLSLQLTRDDTRLAVTETVTATARETRLRDQALAWKLGFDAWRQRCEAGAYRTFKPVPDRWLRASFAEFMAYMSEREALAPMPAGLANEFEQAGWQRRHEVLRFSIVRHAFRRAIEVWLALDLAVHLEKSGYSVRLGRFCDRSLTPRNLMISGRS